MRKLGIWLMGVMVALFASLATAPPLIDSGPQAQAPQHSERYLTQLDTAPAMMAVQAPGAAPEITNLGHAAFSRLGAVLMHPPPAFLLFVLLYSVFMLFSTPARKEDAARVYRRCPGVV